LDQLRIEDDRFQMLNDECRAKMKKYQQMSEAADNKLDHLRSLGDDFSSVDCCKILGLLNFMKRIEESRKFGDVSIRGNVQTVQLASHTKPSKPSYIRSS
jgi:hypothetical protein